MALTQMSYVQAANAIAAFETARWSTANSSWDRYAAGERAALSDGQKVGAVVFSGKAKCAEYHSGNLPTDQQFHTIAVSEIGPGKGTSKPNRIGRALETGQPSDRYASRTPALQNVSMTGPWVHNGAYATLAGALRHHLNPEFSLRNYDKTHLSVVMQATLHNNPATDFPDILATLDDLAKVPVADGL